MHAEDPVCCDDIPIFSVLINSLVFFVEVANIALRFMDKVNNLTGYEPDSSNSDKGQITTFVNHFVRCATHSVFKKNRGGKASETLSHRPSRRKLGGLTM